MHAAEEQARHVGGQVVADHREAELVEDRQVHPGRVVGAEARGEDDGTEAAQVDLGLRVARERLGVRQWWSLVAEPVPQQQAYVVVARVAEGNRGREVVREGRSVSVDALEPPDQADALLLEDAVVQVVAAADSRGLEVRDEPGPRDREAKSWAARRTRPGPAR